MLRPSLPALAALFVTLWGCVAIHAATANAERATHFVVRQLLWLSVGLGVFAAARAVPFETYRRRVAWFVGIPYLALWLVLLAGIRINGMRGWFAWHGLFCQPSELCKPVFVLSVTVVLLRFRDGASGRPGLLPVAGCALAWLLPLALQPDFGAVLVYGIALVVLYWCLGGRFRHLLVGFGAAVCGAVLVLWRYPYVRRRFVAFLDPDRYATGSGWHMLQFRRSLAAGGWFGNSWEMGSWSRAYLPLGHSDSVFAGMAELVGFVGLLPFVVLILAWVVYAHSRASRCSRPENAGVIFGLGAMVAGQAFVHLSVNLGLLPPTGITLPLVSYGGSSLAATMVAFGMLESAWRDDQPAASEPEELDGA
jgi:cell division protein FtsW (lipid II flippase)